MPPVSWRLIARWRVWLLLVGLPVVVSCATGSAPTAATVQIPAPVLLRPTGVPAASGSAGADQPAIYPFLPPAGNNTGAGVLIVPSGTYAGDGENPEGVPVAQWLNAHGLAAFVLRYGSAPGTTGDGAAGEVNGAVQYLHAHAADYQLSATRIGVLGFGAGAGLATDAAFANPSQNNSGSADPVEQASNHPDFLALIYGASAPQTGAARPPPTFLVGSTNAKDNISNMIDLWNFLRSPRVRVPVEAHFFPKVDIGAGLARGDPSLGAWPDLFYNWVRAYGFLTDQPRVAIRGSVWLDGRLPFGYVILTPLDGVGAGPIVARVFNSTAGVTIGTFAVPANQGPVPGRYRVDVRQNANRWLSNAFSADLYRDPAFGHARILSPSIDDQHSYTKTHPNDKDDMMIEIKPEDNPDLKIEVFSK